MEDLATHRSSDEHKAADERERKACFCRLCRKQFTSPAQLVEHLKGKGHKDTMLRRSDPEAFKRMVAEEEAAKEAERAAKGKAKNNRDHTKPDIKEIENDCNSNGRKRSRESGPTPKKKRERTKLRLDLVEKKERFDGEDKRKIHEVAIGGPVKVVPLGGSDLGGFAVAEDDEIDDIFGSLSD